MAYPDATCQDCGEECDTWEILEMQKEDGDDENYSGKDLWCYCKKCDKETNHPIYNN